MTNGKTHKKRNNFTDPVDRRNHYAYIQITVEIETGTNQMEIDMTDFATLVDNAAVLDTEIKRLTAQLDAIKTQLKQAGVGEYDGVLASITVRQNKDSETFDAKKAFEYVSEHLSNQLLTAVKKKFTVTKPGAKVITIDLKLAVAA